FGIFSRGDHAVIGVQPGKTLDNNYSGNVVDICPVGALTDRDFRFKCRVWYLGSTNSVCPGCSRGCNIQIHYNRERDWRRHIAEGGRVMRLKPRYNPDVNQWWMCDEGRYGYKFIDQNRIEKVQVREGAALRPGTWEEGVGAVANRLKALKDAGQMDQVGVVLSSHLTNEDLYAAKRFCAEVGITQVVFQRPRPGEGDNFLIQVDKSPNTRGAQALGIAEGAEALLEQAAKKQLKALLVFTQDLAAIFGESRVAEAAKQLELLAFLGTNANPTSALAHVVLPASVYAEKDGTFTNFQSRVQRIHQAIDPLGESKAEWQILSELGQPLGLKSAFVDPFSIFMDCAQHEPAFRGLVYQALGEHGALLNEDRHGGVR
ncbi:MAG: molybdopterin-dependent oxidoreductase, partial [Candidatus Omnitrophica bacterium]|nr:molybdopterin-dependent oxidoreductase [Candidatus Omnitrophota bacterium]